MGIMKMKLQPREMSPELSRLHDQSPLLPLGLGGREFNAAPLTEATVSVLP